MRQNHRSLISHDDALLFMCCVPLQVIGFGLVFAIFLWKFAKYRYGRTADRGLLLAGHSPLPPGL